MDNVDVTVEAAKYFNKMICDALSKESPQVMARLLMMCGIHIGEDDSVNDVIKKIREVIK